MMFDKLFTKLPEKHLILTPNRRLCTYLTNSYNKWQQKQGNNTWASLITLPFSSWLEQLWENALENTAKLISTNQVSLIWQNIIQTNQPELLKIDETAQAAIEAARLISSWQIDLNDSAFYFQEDCQQFAQWYQQYLKLCQTNNWIDLHHLPDAILKNFANFKIQIEHIEKIILFGFDDIAPAWQQVLESSQQYIDVVSYENSNVPKKKIRYQFNDFKAELKNVIAWLKKEYDINPNQSLGCVIPNLNQYRAYVESEFLKHFSLKDFLQYNNTVEQAYNISAGKSLSSYGLIHIANEILKFNPAKKSIPIEFIKTLLQSPYIIGYYQEYNQRVQLEIQISQYNNFEFSIVFFKKLLQRYCPILALHFNKFLKHTFPYSQSILEHLNYFNSKLELLGWPGDKELSSQNFQLIQRYELVWDEILNFDEFTHLSSVTNTASLIAKLSHKTLFQIRTGEKPIQVLGLLEAAGLHFDKLWLMQANNNILPTSANPNPFIPHSLQRKYQLPHSSSEREWHFAATMFHRLSHSAQEFYVSSTLQNDQEESQPSYLIESWPISETRDELMEPAIKIKESKKLEWYSDTQSLAMTSDEIANIQGGSAILKTQAACPFRAFALYRLKITEPSLPQTGLTALERGNIVHASLELFWQRIKSQQELLQLSEDDRNVILEQCIRAAVLSINPNIANTAPKLLQIEITRLLKVLNAWLDLEAKRDAFHIYRLEELLETNFADLPLRLRIDRIDQLNSGALILIDYKTGITSPNAWFNERIDEPQLPLYALIYPEKIDGVLFGQIKQNNFSIKGVINSTQTQIENKKTSGINIKEEQDWQNIKNFWEHELKQITEEFLKGNAIVNPKYGNQTCQFCNLASFCRIEEINNGIE